MQWLRGLTDYFTANPRQRCVGAIIVALQR